MQNCHKMQNSYKGAQNKPQRDARGQKRRRWNNHKERQDSCKETGNNPTQKMQHCHKQTQNSNITRKQPQTEDANWSKDGFITNRERHKKTTDSKQQHNSHTQPFSHFWTRGERGSPKYTPERNPVRISKMNPAALWPSSDREIAGYLVTGRHDKWRNLTKRHSHTHSNRGQ